VATLAEQIASLKAARATGVLTSRLADGRTVTYRSDAELVAAIAALEAEQAASTGTATVRRLQLDLGRGL
jgi:hypothetical protein